MNIVNPKSPAQSASYENDLVQVRKFVVTAEEILHEGGPRPTRPLTPWRRRKHRMPSAQLSLPFDGGSSHDAVVELDGNLLPTP